MGAWGETLAGNEAGLTIRSVVKTETLFQMRNHIRVMLVYRLDDSTIDEMNDREIAKSALFTVTSNDQLIIDTPIPSHVFERGTPNKEGLFSVELKVYLAALPPWIGTDKINSLSDVKVYGGDILSVNGFAVSGTKRKRQQLKLSSN